MTVQKQKLNRRGLMTTCLFVCAVTMGFVYYIYVHLTTKVEYFCKK